ncbi:MAG: rRNA maturation RNase YbeY [Patescibacteria group bacterium]
MLDLVYENQTSDLYWSEDFFVKVFSHALEHINLNKPDPQGRGLAKGGKVELGLHLVTPERSQELNLKYRQKDKPTDVLSFPLNEHGLENYGILPVGDIFICLDVARRQAEEINIPLDQELARLSVHGLLHLLGYDHELSPEDEKKMIDLQEDIVLSLDL